MSFGLAIKICGYLCRTLAQTHVPKAPKEILLFVRIPHSHFVLITLKSEYKSFHRIAMKSLWAFLYKSQQYLPLPETLQNYRK